MCMFVCTYEERCVFFHKFTICYDFIYNRYIKLKCSFFFIFFKFNFFLIILDIAKGNFVDCLVFIPAVQPQPLLSHGSKIRLLINVHKTSIIFRLVVNVNITFCSIFAFNVDRQITRRWKLAM